MSDLIFQSMFNFVTHKKSVIDFSKFDSLRIYGENRDNKSMSKNGTGKTLILDGCCWCLTGKMIRGGSAGVVIGNFSKYCSVEQIWKDQDRYIKVKRYRKHPKYRNMAFVYFSDDGKTWSKDRSKETATDTDLYIQKLFKIDYDLFVAGVVLTKPHQSLDFCESKDTKRKEVLTNLLNLSWIDDAKAKAKNDMEKYTDEFNTVEGKIGNLESQFHNLDDEYSSAKQRSKKFKNDIQKEVDIAELKFKRLKTINGDNYQSKIKVLEKNKSIYLKKHKVLESLNDKSVLERSKIEKQYGEIERIENDLKELEKSKKINLAKDFIDGDLCLECGSIYHKKNIHILINRIESGLKQKNTILKIEKDRCNKMCESREKILKEIEMYSKYTMKNISVIDENIHGLKEKIIQQKHNNEMIKSLKESVAEIKTRENPWIEIIKNKYSKKKIVLVKINELKIQLKKIKSQIKYCKVALDAYGNSGIKNDIISSKIQLLEERINYYLSKITDGDIFIKLTNKVQHGKSERIGILIQDGKKKKPLDYLLWSGGEKCRIKFAVEWSINSIMESPINLLFIDEGFDNLDSTGIKIILELMREEKKRVICISNLESMKNIFKDSIKVVLENSISRIEK